MLSSRLEIVHVRAARVDLQGLVEEARRQAARAGEAATVRIYRRAGVPTDLAVHIRVETDRRDAATSDLGLRLAAALREHGMVTHAVWLEADEEATS